MSTKQRVKCLIIEDEPFAQHLLMDHVERIDLLQLVGTADNAQEALRVANREKPDLLLLDIRMPGMTGFEMLNLLPKPVPLVIVTTAYRQYALEGYEHALVDFLIKPVEFERFQEAINRVRERLGVRESFQVESDLPERALTATQKMLTVRIDRSLVNIPFPNIQYIEALDNYVKIHQLSRTQLTKIPISKMESVLPTTEFIRINRKYIVRTALIQQVNSTFVQLFNGLDLPLGLTYRDVVRQAVLER